jgi:type I restriction enzyme S subunit
MQNESLLSDVIEEISMGPFGSDITIDNYIASGVPVLNGSNLDKFKLTENSFKYVSEEKAKTFRKAIARRGDIVITHRGTLGQISYIPKNSKFENYVISQSQFRVKFNSKAIDSRYIVYLFHSDYGQKKLLSFKNHVGVPALAQATTNFRNLKLRIHEINEQRKIADVISSIEDKIELNNRINAELEAMAKTLYDYWFVQFDFPNAKSKPYKTSGGKMIWNEELKREIPTGWGVVKMEEWIDINKSGDWGKEEQEGNFTKKVTCIRGADINGLNGLAELKPPTRYILDKNSFKVLKSHDIVIEISGGSPTQSTGRMAYITDAMLKRFENPLICSNFCRPVSIKNKKLLYNFVYYWNSLYDAGIFFGYEGKTSGIKNLLLDSFVRSYYTVVPEESIVNKFYDFMQNIQSKKQTALAENQKLVELRDWLLPMLMNGQVKIVDAKDKVELQMAAEPQIAYKKK